MSRDANERLTGQRLGPDSAATDLVPMQGPGHPMKCLLCGGKTEEYCGPVVHHVDCKHYVAPDPNARKMTADEIDALMGFDQPAPAAPACPVHETCVDLKKCRAENACVDDIPNARIEAETARADQAEERVRALEALRPVWAMGHTSDSIAAQVNAAALSDIWAMLGVSNQSAAMDVLRALLSNRGGT